MTNVWNESRQPDTDPHPTDINAGRPYYRVRLEHPQFGIIFEQVNANVGDATTAEELAESWHPGYDAVWSNLQWANRGVCSNGFAMGNTPQYVRD